jgi:hypothetical protein
MSTTTAGRLIAAVAVLGLALSGCGGGPGAPEPDRLVLEPPAPGSTGSTGHTHDTGGYRIVDLRLPRSTDGPGRMSFRIIDIYGRPLTRYAVQQTKQMHLYVVRTDLAVYRHLHPTLARGTWSAPVDLAEPGDYRVVADFLPTGASGSMVLRADAVVPGRWRPAPVPRADDGGEADDGAVNVRVDGAGTVGDAGRLRFVVSTLDGDPVRLGSYLGATAHVSGFRITRRPIDQDFVHVHPYGAPEETEDGTALTFHTTFERPGDHRFFVQVRVDGVVHTVAVTASVGR